MFLPCICIVYTHTNIDLSTVLSILTGGALQNSIWQTICKFMPQLGVPILNIGTVLLQSCFIPKYNKIFMVGEGGGGGGLKFPKTVVPRIGIGYHVLTNRNAVIQFLPMREQLNSFTLNKEKKKQWFSKIAWWGSRSGFGPDFLLPDPDLDKKDRIWKKLTASGLDSA